ncbi:MAG: DsbA family protein [Anaerolineae bacterium]|nr:DsbA family protein [Anaerolineae bacterium]NUQ02392.1 thioredoxin domain-containing protein [Anaerolineae bacterium]
MSTSAVNKTPRQEAAPAVGAQRQRGLLVIGAVVVIAVVAVILIIVLGSANATKIDYATIPQSRTSDGGFVLGNPEAPITLIEFADFACPHCQAYHPTTQQFIQEHVVTGKAKFEYRIMPTTGGELSVFTGQLLVCADQISPGAFWTGKDLMYTYATTGRYNRDVGRLLAQDLGISYSDMLACSSDIDQVSIDLALASNMGVTGTPATMVRYGDGAPQWISFGGVTYDRGGAPINVLTSIVNAANQVQ